MIVKHNFSQFKKAIFNEKKGIKNNLDELAEYIQKTECKCIFTTSELLDNVSQALKGSNVSFNIKKIIFKLMSYLLILYKNFKKHDY
jgi:DNA-binding ferritin-like protein